MTYTVIWRDAALAKLAQIWSDAPDRQSVANSANEIDEILRRTGAEAGESRDGKRRFLSVGSLAVYFEVDAGDCRVDVTAVWQPH